MLKRFIARKVYLQYALQKLAHAIYRDFFSCKAVLTSTHNLCFGGKIRKNRYTPVNPSFAIYKWGMRGYILHGYVFMMTCTIVVYGCQKTFAAKPLEQVFMASFLEQKLGPK